MADPREKTGAQTATAHEVFSAWLTRLKEPDGEHFEELCANHPVLAVELRQFHSVLLFAQAAATSRSFHHTLREEFGEVAEVTVKLEEGSAPLPCGVSSACDKTVVASFRGPPLGGSVAEPAEAGTPNQGSRYVL